MKKAIPMMLVLIGVILSGCADTENSNITRVNVSSNIQVFERTNANLNGQIVEVKFDRDYVIAGEKVMAELNIANIGNETIVNETVEIQAKLIRLNDFLANLYVKTLPDEKKTRTITIDFDKKIEPGTVKVLSAIFTTQKEMQGRSLAGDYEITVILNVNGQRSDSRMLPITLHSGIPREFTPTPAPTPVPSPTPASTPLLIPTPAPTPTPIPTQEPVVVVTPTGETVPLRVMNYKFTAEDIQINAGDEVVWDNLDDISYTVAEMDNRMPNMTLRDLGRLTYVFDKPGDYKFGLYYRYMRTYPSIQTIRVR